MQFCYEGGPIMTVPLCPPKPNELLNEGPGLQTLGSPTTKSI